MNGGNPLDDYQEIAIAGKYKNVKLVLHRETGRIYVRKCLDVYNRDVYRSVMRVHNIHIAEIVEAAESDGKLYVIEEYINGETLEERLSRGYQFSEQEAVETMIQLAEALRVLHAQTPPVIHRDVKLSNVMISHDGIVKLIDFNAARLYDPNLSQDTTFIGTQSYAAPEQFGFSQTDARTDIYALGVVFNYLLTGEHVSKKTAGGRYGAIIKKCVEMDPDKRYQSADLLLDALKGRAETGNGKKKSKKQRQSPWPIPGFRSGKPVNIIAASIGYFSIFVFVMDIIHEPLISSWGLFEGIEFAVSSLLGVAVATNYLGMGKLFPLMGDRHPLSRVATGIAVGILSLLVLVRIEIFLYGHFAI